MFNSIHLHRIYYTLPSNNNNNNWCTSSSSQLDRSCPKTWLSAEDCTRRKDGRKSDTRKTKKKDVGPILMEQETRRSVTRSWREELKTGSSGTIINWTCLRAEHTRIIIIIIIIIILVAAVITFYKSSRLIGSSSKLLLIDHRSVIAWSDRLCMAPPFLISCRGQTDKISRSKGHSESSYSQSSARTAAYLDGEVGQQPSDIFQ